MSRRTTEAGIFAAAVLVGWGLNVPRADACTIICGAKPPTVSYPYVLLGKVVETRREGDQERFVVEAVRVWKGGWPGDATRFRVTTEAGGGRCGYGLVDGAYYVIVASTEPQEVGQCNHEPVPLARASETIADLDKARELAPLKLPREAFLSPSQLRCPPTPEDSKIDQNIQDADLVVVARLPEQVPPGPDDETIVVKLGVIRSLKGRAPRDVSVEMTRRYANFGPRNESIWFLDDELPDGRRRIITRASPSDSHVVSRLERWPLFGRGCLRQPPSE